MFSGRLSLLWLMGLLAVFFLGGCVITAESRHNREFFVRWGTEVAAGTRTSQSADVSATDRVEVESQPLLDYLATDDEDSKTP